MTGGSGAPEEEKKHKDEVLSNSYEQIGQLHIEKIDIQNSDKTQTVQSLHLIQRQQHSYDVFHSQFWFNNKHLHHLGKQTSCS